METNYNDYSSIYLEDSRSVLLAAKYLRDNVAKFPRKQNYLIDQLAEAAERQNSGSTGYRNFMFYHQSMSDDERTHGNTAQDSMVAILIDLQISNMLIAAGQVVDSPKARGISLDKFDQAIISLENTLEEEAGPRYKGFIGGQNKVNSPDISKAKEAFCLHSADTLNTIVRESGIVVTGIISSLSKLEDKQVEEMISTLSIPVSSIKNISKIGNKLFGIAIEKLEIAINALVDFAGHERLAEINDEMRIFLSNVREGNLVSEYLNWVFGIERIRVQIADLLKMEGLDSRILDQASDSLIQLNVNFRKNMKISKEIVSAINLSLVLSLVVGSGLTVISATFARLLVLAAIILIGRDYAGSGNTFRVEGVGEIARKILPR